jgi:hypothetical protein
MVPCSWQGNSHGGASPYGIPEAAALAGRRRRTATMQATGRLFMANLAKDAI